MEEAVKSPGATKGLRMVVLAVIAEPAKAVALAAPCILWVAARGVKLGGDGTATA
jgi:hypothetical protein